MRAGKLQKAQGGRTHVASQHVLQHVVLVAIRYLHLSPVCGIQFMLELLYLCGTIQQRGPGGKTRQRADCGPRMAKELATESQELCRENNEARKECHQFPRSPHFLSSKLGDFEGALGNDCPAVRGSPSCQCVSDCEGLHRVCAGEGGIPTRLRNKTSLRATLMMFCTTHWLSFCVTSWA